MKESKKRFFHFLVYLFLFYGLWTGYVFTVYPRVQSLGDTTLLYALVNITIKLLVWVLPVILFLRLIDHVDPIEYLKLKQNWKQGLLIGLVLSLLILFGNFLQHGIPYLNSASLTWNGILSTSVLIGFFEEIPYRGFILQKFEERVGFWWANLITSILFLSIHLPGWISLHLLKAYSVITVFIFGTVMAVIFKFGRSLWGPIVAHSLNDFISAVLFRL